MLRGRDRERAAVTALLGEARTGRGGALVLRGQPGVGKSALLADIVRDVAGMVVLRTQGVESESPLAFASLQRLLRPVLRLADRIPQPQARALRAALGESSDPVDDRFLVFLAVLSLLAEAGEEAPVLAVVDDAHWLDEASAAALLFAARRLQDEHVALVFAARDGDVRQLDSGDLPCLTVDGLDREAAGRLLTERAGAEVPADVRDALVAGTGGNPLALVELADALTAEQLTGTAPLPVRMPLTEGVERAFLDRHHRLPPDARTLLLVAAADDSGRVRVVRQAAGELGVGEEALEAAERSGLLRVESAALELRHPLVRSAVYGSATSTQRRRVHRALAAVLRADADVDRRAWHLAASVEEPDSEVVAELDRAADRARQRGGLEAAASAWERAAELSADGDGRARRLYLAARALWLAAHAARARSLTDAAAALATDPGLRADAVRLRARIEWNTGSLDVGHRMVLQAAADVAPYDAQRAREMAMFAVALAAFGARSQTGLDPAALVPAPSAGEPPRASCFDDMLHGLDAVSRSDWPAAVPRLRRAFAAVHVLEEDDHDLWPNLGIAALHLGDDGLALRFHDELLARARSSGAVVMIIYALTRRSLSEIATGAWSSAAAGSAEALSLAEHSGEQGLAALPTAVLALLAAARGDDAADVHLTELDRITASRPLGILAAIVADLGCWTRGLRAPDPAAAFHALAQVAHPMTRQLAVIDRVEAAVAVDRHAEARTWVAELEAFVTATGSPWAAAAAAHGCALLAGGEEAERHFARSLQEHARSPRLPDRARTELALGEFLRRGRRRVDARPHLRAALQAFEDLGAEQWAERARRELRASGETARRRSDPSPVGLTPQELQVAGLVRQGLSNREVAARLFVSPRTVDFHLRNVYGKLGLTSRTELAAHPLS